jgi:excisionase family DNA binding protein
MFWLEKTMEHGEDQKKWMTTKQVAEYLSLSVSQVYNLTSNGYLPYYKLGERMNRYLKEEIDDFIKSRDSGDSVIRR